MKKQLIGALSLSLALFAAACDDDSITSPPNDEPVETPPDSVFVSISAAQETLTLGGSIGITVTIENQSEFKVQWGAGSSSCRLHSIVVAGEDILPMIDDRWCTMDAMPYYLDPGESLTQSWNWFGSVFERKGILELPPGTYEVQGTGGSRRSEPITIEIVE